VNDSRRRLSRQESGHVLGEDRTVRRDHERAKWTERREVAMHRPKVGMVDSGGWSHAEEVRLKTRVLRGQGMGADVGRVTPADLDLWVSARDEDDGASQRDEAGPV
jgi:hypothetical protein